MKCSLHEVKHVSEVLVCSVSAICARTIQRNLAAWIALYPLEGLRGTLIGLLMDSRNRDCEFCDLHFGEPQS